MSKNVCDWVVTGGRVGESAYCRRCGEGLILGMPIRIEVFLAAARAFEKSHRSCKEPGYKEPVPANLLEWALSRDVGVSSMTIWSAVTGRPSPYGAYDVPHDPDDFARCYRLIKHFPEIEPQLQKVAELHSRWIPFVQNWPELTELYEQESPSGNCQKLYERLQQLRGVVDA